MNDFDKNQNQPLQPTDNTSSDGNPPNPTGNNPQANRPIMVTEEEASSPAQASSPLTPASPTQAPPSPSNDDTPPPPMPTQTPPFGTPPQPPEPPKQDIPPTINPSPQPPPSGDPASDLMPDTNISSDIPPVIQPPQKSGKAKIIGAVVAILLLVVAIPIGVVLVQQQQELREQAAGGCTDQNLLSQAGSIVAAVDGQSLATQDCTQVASFVTVHQSNAGSIWAREHNLELAGPIVPATDGQTLRDQPDEVVAAFVAAHGTNAGRQWAEDHNAEIAQPSPTTPPQPTIVQPPDTSQCPELANAGTIAVAADGQSLATQDCAQVASFVTVHGTNAGSVWATEHNLEIGCGKRPNGDPDCPIAKDGQSLATQDPAIIASFVSKWLEQLGTGVGFRWQLEHDLEMTCTPPIATASDGQTLRDQSSSVISQYLEASGADACQVWADAHDAEVGTPPSTPGSAQCRGVLAYDLQNNRLSGSELTQLGPSDVIRVAVNANPASPFTKARFRFCEDNICPNTWDERTQTTVLEGQTMYYMEYTISGAQRYNVQAQLYHNALGRWF